MSWGLSCDAIAVLWSLHDFYLWLCPTPVLVRLGDNLRFLPSRRVSLASFLLAPLPLSFSAVWCWVFFFWKAETIESRDFLAGETAAPQLRFQVDLAVRSSTREFKQPRWDKGWALGALRSWCKKAHRAYTRSIPVLTRRTGCMYAYKHFRVQLPIV